MYLECIKVHFRLEYAAEKYNIDMELKSFMR